MPGYFAVDARKKRVLARAAKSYLAQLRARPRTFRFDVVEVTFPAAPAPNSGAAATAAAPSGRPEILHFENVSLFGKYFQG